MSHYDELYNLDMMETRNIGSFKVTRVPDGWIFKSITLHFRGYSACRNGSESMVFVPYTARDPRDNPKEKL